MLHLNKYFARLLKVLKPERLNVRYRSFFHQKDQKAKEPLQPKEVIPYLPFENRTLTKTEELLISEMPLARSQSQKAILAAGNIRFGNEKEERTANDSTQMRSLSVVVNGKLIPPSEGLLNMLEICMKASQPVKSKT